MSLELKEISAGIVLALCVLLAFRFARIHRERGVYAVVLVAASLPYVMFAVQTWKTDLANSIAFSVLVGVLAIAGARWTMWLVAGGFVLHGIYAGVLHYTSLFAPTPCWYGPVCMSFDFAMALGLAGYIVQGNKASDMP